MNLKLNEFKTEWNKFTWIYDLHGSPMSLIIKVNIRNKLQYKKNEEDGEMKYPKQTAYFINRKQDNRIQLSIMITVHYCECKQLLSLMKRIKVITGIIKLNK